jgi:hypothetical protein
LGEWEDTSREPPKRIYEKRRILELREKYCAIIVDVDMWYEAMDGALRLLHMKPSADKYEFAFDKIWLWAENRHAVWKLAGDTFVDSLYSILVNAIDECAILIGNGPNQYLMTNWVKVGRKYGRQA